MTTAIEAKKKSRRLRLLTYIRSAFGKKVNADIIHAI